jgi:two-component system KDP operon response regulator KdpE
MTTRPPLVLIAAPDAAIVEFARRELRRIGLRVITADHGERALRAAQEQHPDLVLLATSLPGIPGLEVLRRLRARGAVPAIVLAPARTAGRADQRGRRASEVLTQPFSAEELVTRVTEALGRRSAGQGATRITTPGLDIDLERYSVQRNGREVTLTRTEWNLLAYLARYAGQTLASADILSDVWGPEYRDDLQYLRVWISRLRTKLGGGEAREIIRTVRGVGYTFDPTAPAPSPAPRRRTRTPAAAR